MGLNFGRGTLVSLYWRHFGWHPGDLAGAEIGARRPHRSHEEIHLREPILAAVTDQEMHLETAAQLGGNPTIRLVHLWQDALEE